MCRGRFIQASAAVASERDRIGTGIVTIPPRRPNLNWVMSRDRSPSATASHVVRVEFGIEGGFAASRAGLVEVVADRGSHR